MGGLPSKVSNFVHQTIKSIERIPRRKIVYIGVIAACAIGVPVLVYVVGFTPTGVAAFSLAATWQATIGNVAAGSAFAILQSLGTAPLLLAIIGGLIGAAGCSIHSLWTNFGMRGEDEEGESQIVWVLEK